MFWLGPYVPIVLDAPGSLRGIVLDTTGKPVADATVAIQDKDGKVLAWAKSDAQGKYVLPKPPLEVLHLRPSRHRGLMERVARGAGNLVTAPVKIVSSTVKQVDPVGMTKAAVVSAATANPAAVTAQVVAGAGRAATDQAKQRAKENATRAVLGERQSSPKTARATTIPGEIYVSVAAPGFRDLKGKMGAYWLEPDTKTPELQAWMETVKLAPVALKDGKSVVEDSAVLLTDGHADPSLAPAGGVVALSVKLATPGNQPLNVRLFAREKRKHTTVELKPKEGAPGIYTGNLTLETDLKEGETQISLVALRAVPIDVRLAEKQGDPLLAFVRDCDDLDAGKPYDFDMRIMASENRLDLTVVVLDPKKGSEGAPATKKENP